MSGNGTKPDHEGLAAAIARALKPQFDGITSEVAGLRGEMNARLDQTNARLDQTNWRLDQVIENTGGHYRRLEERDSRPRSSRATTRTRAD